MILVSVVAAAAALPPALAGARAPDRRCYPRDAYEYAASTRARLYEVPAAGDSDRRTLLVCDLLTGRRTTVDAALDTEESFQPREVRFGGRIVAFRLEHCIKAECDEHFYAVDARTGRGAPGGPSRPPVAWAVSPAGALAWVEFDTTLRLKSSDGGSAVVRDEGVGIDPDSLAFADDGRLYWIRDGQPRVVRPAVSPPPAATADPRGSPRCYPRGSRTLAASTRVRVLALHSPAADRALACDLRSGRRSELLAGHPDDHPGLYAVRIRGPFVAFAGSACVRGDCIYGGPQVVDVRIGRAPYDVAVPTRGQRVRELVLAANGSLAWIGDGNSTASVARCDSRGCAVVGGGPVSETAGLALSGASHLYWTAGGKPRSTDLR